MTQTVECILHYFSFEWQSNMCPTDTRYLCQFLSASVALAHLTWRLNGVCPSEKPLANDVECGLCVEAGCLHDANWGSVGAALGPAPSPSVR